MIQTTFTQTISIVVLPALIRYDIIVGKLAVTPFDDAMEADPMKRFWMKGMLAWIAVLALMFGHINAQACVLLYSGGEMTDDGANMFMRSEEIYTDDNKVYYVSHPRYTSI